MKNKSVYHSILIGSLIISILFSTVSAQFTCSTICSLMNNCNSGICTISDCSDGNLGCFQFCLNCAGVRQCSQVGFSCQPNENYTTLNPFNLNSSSNMKYSLPLVLISFLSFFLIKS